MHKLIQQFLSVFSKPPRKMTKWEASENQRARQENQRFKDYLDSRFIS